MDESLQISTSIKNGWTLCCSEDDQNQLSLLMEINENEEPPNLSEMETLYKPPSGIGSLIKLLWIDQTAVGFYFLRLKGPQSDSHVSLHMNILDGVFIRKHYRRKGWATSMLQDILKSFPDQDIGLSHPISHSLHSVVTKFLENHAEYRPKFWCVHNCGEEGDRLNFWFSRKNKFSK